VSINAGDSAGTGFVLSADGTIATNAHVVGTEDTVEVAFSDGTTLDGTVVGIDPSFDLAVVKVEASGLPVVEIGDSDSVQIGDAVVAIGNALGLEGGLSVTSGIISGPPRDVPEPNGVTLEGALQTDAAINPGNSGGPLVDSQGRVVGINTAIADPSTSVNVGFAIAISNVQPVIEDLAAGLVPAFLGVGTADLTDAQIERLGEETGAVVVDVSADSPAAAAGIEEDDLIVEIGGTAIESAGDVPSAVREHRPGDTIDVVFVREGERQTVQATLIERPDVG
jgi:S1-C subfamily serine protease